MDETEKERPHIPNAETIAAMEEVERMINDPSLKRSSSVSEFFAEMEAELAAEEENKV